MVFDTSSLPFGGALQLRDRLTLMCLRLMLMQPVAAATDLCMHLKVKINLHMHPEYAANLLTQIGTQCVSFWMRHYHTVELSLLYIRFFLQPS